MYDHTGNVHMSLCSHDTILRHNFEDRFIYCYYRKVKKLERLDKNCSLTHFTGIWQAPAKVETSCEHVSQTSEAIKMKFEFESKRNGGEIFIFLVQCHGSHRFFR